ncbi:MAG: amidohydrolase family protein [Bacteroidota bacterium]
MPGLIEGHSHLFLHPYNETAWDDQVLKESRAERTARAVNHAKATLMAGFTTVRDLGTEGALYDDAGLKKAIEKGVIPGSPDDRGDKGHRCQRNLWTKK